MGKVNNCALMKNTATIEMVDLKLNAKRTTLYLRVKACGHIQSISIAIGNPSTSTYQNVYFRNPNEPRESEMILELDGTDFGLLKGEPIGSFITVQVKDVRCFDSNGKYEGCTGSVAQTVVENTELFGVASFWDVYPCLTNKILNIDDSCKSCQDIDNALVLDMLIKSIEIYLRRQRIDDAYLSYLKAKDMCSDYYSIDHPDFDDCDGGIGCWIVNSNFVVT